MEKGMKENSMSYFSWEDSCVTDELGIVLKERKCMMQ